MIPTKADKIKMVTEALEAYKLVPMGVASPLGFDIIRYVGIEDTLGQQSCPDKKGWLKVEEDSL